MTLAKWAEYGWLKAEPTSPAEIRDLPGIVSRDLADASVEAISDDRRFEAAFSAARTAANAALRACGYRTAGWSSSEDHRIFGAHDSGESQPDTEAQSSFKKEKRHQL